MGAVSIVFLFLFTGTGQAISFNTSTGSNLFRFNQSESPCRGAVEHTGFPNSCSYALAHQECQSGGLIEYIQIFYCISASSGSSLRVLKQSLCFLALSLWLLALFYMLANTAADYFCSCLQRLSHILRLPATVAGVTLLPLGNGAPDVFASVVAFMGSRGAEVGLNSVLGGAVFVVTIVAGVVNILSADSTPIDGLCFARDGIFLAASLSALMLLFWRGRVNRLEALGYVGIYLLYAIVVIVWEIYRSQAEKRKQRIMDEEKAQKSKQPPKTDLASVVTLPEWLWKSHLTMFTHESHAPDGNLSPPADEPGPLTEPLLAPRLEAGGEETDQPRMNKTKSFLNLSRKASQLLIEMPLALPRQLTIPVVDETRWSRPRATVAASLAPILLVAVWSAENSSPITQDVWVLAGGILLGICFGVAAYFTTLDERPPEGHLALTWIIAGFFMSIVWFYVIARELVAALVSLAAVLVIDVGLVGLTVLAWGNSMGDLVANTALARQGGTVGVQIAMSGCYASPMFNTLIGLGLSLLIAAAKSKGGVYYIPDAGRGMVTVGFIGAGLAAAGGVLWLNKMRPSKWLGIGLICLYSSFMLLRGLESFLS